MTYESGQCPYGKDKTEFPVPSDPLLVLGARRVQISTHVLCRITFCDQYYVGVVDHNTQNVYNLLWMII